MIPGSRFPVVSAAAAVLALCAAGCGAPDSTPVGESAPAEPAAPPEFRIAYNVLEDEEADDYEVFVMNLDGTGQRNLTDHPAVDWVYAAHGETLFMVSDRDEEKRRYRLYEMAASGGAPKRITDFPVRDSWIGIAPDGDELVIASSRDGQADLYLIGRDGGDLARLTDDPEYDNDPSLSPDGRTVAWRSRRTRVDEIWVMDLETRAMRRLTHYPEDDPALDEHAYHAGPPVWIPGRDAISFCSKRRGTNSIYTIGLDGTGLEQITPDGTDQCWHSWSPDGRWLAYDGNDEAGNYDIYLRDMMTGQTQRLTDHPRYEQAPVFVVAGSGGP